MDGFYYINHRPNDFVIHFFPLQEEDKLILERATNEVVPNISDGFLR